MLKPKAGAQLSTTSEEAQNAMTSLASKVSHTSASSTLMERLCSLVTPQAALTLRRTSTLFSKVRPSQERVAHLLPEKQRKRERKEKKSLQRCSALSPSASLMDARSSKALKSSLPSSRGPSSSLSLTEK